MRLILINAFFLILGLTASAQSKIDWNEKYMLQFSDFQSSTTQISHGAVNMIQSGAYIDFAFHMSNAEFMFTKNFNSKVSCQFARSSSSIIAQDSAAATSLLNFARFDFDMTELYARKFRKKLLENKKAFSDVGFFRPLHDEIQKELSERRTTAGKITELGTHAEKLKALHEEVLTELQSLSDYCKECKPTRTKKK